MLDQLNTEAAGLGGNWVNLRTKAQGAIEGKVVSFEVRDRTWEGSVVFKKGTTTPRKEWVFVLDCGDEEPVNLSLNESGQRAVAAALRDAGVKAKEGDTLKIAVKTDPPTEREQAEYQARWTPCANTLDVPAAEPDDGDPF
jgi:hypothetical protein